MVIRKKQLLERVKELLAEAKDGKLPKFAPKTIPYKTAGSKYAEDTLRITGSRDFIDAVLARLAENILPYENPTQRLQISLQETTDRKSQEKTGSWVCYIQFFERGEEAKTANTIVSAMVGQETIITAA